MRSTDNSLVPARQRLAKATTAPAAAHHGAIEVHQVALVEKPQRKALLGRVLFGKPGIGHRAQFVQYGCDGRARNDLELGTLADRAPMRVAQIRPRRTVQRKSIERHARLFAQFAEIQTEIDVQGQILRLHLIEHRRDRHHIAIFQKLPCQRFTGFGRPDRVAHRHPAVPGHLVHDERRALGVEQQILVAEQRKIGGGVVDIGDQCRSAFQIRLARRRHGRRRRPQQAPQTIGRGNHGREQRGAKAARRRCVKCELPPQFIVVGHVPIREYHQPGGGREYQEQCEDPGAGVVLFDQRSTPPEAASSRNQDDDDHCEYGGLFVVETLEKRQQNSGAQQPNRQPPRCIEPPVQAHGQSPAGPHPRRCRANATTRERAAARNSRSRFQAIAEVRCGSGEQQHGARHEHGDRNGLGSDGNQKRTAEPHQSHRGPRCTHSSWAPSNTSASAKGAK